MTLMKTFNEIKNELKEKNLTKGQISRKIVAFKLAKLIVSEAFYVSLSAIPFTLGMAYFGFEPGIALIYVVSHFLFYKFYIKKQYEKDMRPASDEVKATIEALRELKFEK